MHKAHLTKPSTWFSARTKRIERALQILLTRTPTGLVDLTLRPSYFSDLMAGVLKDAHERCHVQDMVIASLCRLDVELPLDDLLRFAASPIFKFHVHAHDRSNWYVRIARKLNELTPSEALATLAPHTDGLGTVASLYLIASIFNTEERVAGLDKTSVALVYMLSQIVGPDGLSTDLSPNALYIPRINEIVRTLLQATQQDESTGTSAE